MAIDNPQRSVLLIGKSQLVLDDALAGLRDLGYNAEATNDFADVTARFDARELDLVVFGGQVPTDFKAELREEISATNPRVIFVQGLDQAERIFTPTLSRGRGRRCSSPGPSGEVDSRRGFDRAMPRAGFRARGTRKRVDRAGGARVRA